jgi:hypothetical protein
VQGGLFFDAFFDGAVGRGKRFEVAILSVESPPEQRISLAMLLAIPSRLILLSNLCFYLFQVTLSSKFAILIRCSHLEVPPIAKPFAIAPQLGDIGSNSPARIGKAFCDRHHGIGPCLAPLYPGNWE